MKWLTVVRSFLCKRLARAREKCPNIETLKKVGREAGKEAGVTVEIEAEEAVRWARHNPIKVIVGIIGTIFILK